MNTAKISQLEKALENKHITPALKSKIEDAIAKLRAEDAQKEPEQKEPAPAPAPIQRKKSVEPKIRKASVKKPKNVLLKKEPVKSESGKKQTVFQKAKEIRTDGESWASARKRASAMIGKEAKEKTAVSDSEIKKLLAKVRRSKQLRKLIGKTDIVRDAKRKALPIGKRMSKDGNVYYETRANRTDIGTKGKYHLELGGNLAGQLGGGAHVPEVMLNGNTGKDYTGLVGETGGLSSGELFEGGGEVGSEVELKKGYGYYDVTKYGYGNDFKRFTENTKGKFSKGTRKTGSEIVVLLADGRKVITQKQAINIEDSDKKQELFDKNKHLWTFGYESGGQANAETMSEATTSYENLYLDEGATVGYAKGGSLSNHGLRTGDVLIKTLSGGTQKIKDRTGKTKYVNLADGYRGDIPPMPYKKGGVTSERKFVNKDQDYEIDYAKNKPQRAGYKGNKNFKKDTPDKKLFGGLSNKKPKYVGNQIMTKSNGMVQVLAYDDSKQQVQVFTVGKAGDKPRWIEVSELIIDESKMEKGGNAGSSSKGDKFRAVTKLAKEIRKDDETWRSALNRAWAQSK